MAILNLPHPFLRSTTIPLDNILMVSRENHCSFRKGLKLLGVIMLKTSFSLKHSASVNMEVVFVSKCGANVNSVLYCTVVVLDV